MAFSKTMLRAFLLYLIHSTLVNSAQILAPPDDSILTDPDIIEAGNYSLANTSSPLANDPHFSFAVFEGTVKLPGKACLMVAFETLVTLAFRNFTGPFTDGAFWSDDYPEVIIGVKTFRKPGPKFQTGNAVHAVKDLITIMARQNRYRNSTISIRWTKGGIPVPWASVRFFAAGSATTPKASRLAPTMKARPYGPYLANSTAIDNGTEVVSADVNVDDDQLLVFAEFDGVTLAIPDVFITLYASILHIARFPSTDAMVPFKTTPENTNARLQYDLIDPPPASTFVFQYGWAARSLQTLPKYMFEQGKFNEIKLISGWDKTLFAVGSLKKNTLSGARVDVERV
ncbi:MAG: hypothetical protein Q9161_004360 [Pseudevernia consocians]